MTRILLYSDESPLVRVLELALSRAAGFRVVPARNSVAGFLDRLAHGEPDIILIDLTPKIGPAMLSEMARAVTSGKIVLWVNTISPDLAFRAMGLGIRGILRKALPTDLQVKCLQRIQAGELWFEKALIDGFFSDPRRAAYTHPVGGPPLQ